MLTQDPQQRAERLKELTAVLHQDAAPEDRELLLAFAPPVFAELPDWIALGLAMPALAKRVRDYFHFFVRELPPPQQLYKGLPGIHAVARNPEEPVDQRTLGGTVLPHETTLVETHTPDAPFIFESLKHYFRKAGIRVFSAIHPVIAVRRQWERIVWMGAAHEEGSRESFCHFRLERIDSKERLRRIEHEIYCVLKCLFTAVEDFQDMLRAARDLKPRLKPRRGDSGQVESARAFIDWLLADNYIFMGTVRYRIGSDGEPHRIQETAAGVFTDATLLPVVFPGVVEEVERHIVPEREDDRIVDIDYCNNATAIYHLEPIDDIVIREWDEQGNLSGATVLLGRFAMGAFTQKASDVPLLHEKQEFMLRETGMLPSSYVWREVRALFNRFPKRELFYADPEQLKEVFERIVYMAGDDEIAVSARRGRGYVALYVAFSRLRYSYKIEEDLARAFEESFGAITFRTSADCGAVTLLLFYFDSSRLDQAVAVESARRVIAARITTWEDRVAAAIDQSFGEREGRRLFKRYITDETRSGLYREATPPEEVAEDLRRLESLEGRLELRLIKRSPESVTLKLYSVRALGLTETLRTLGHLGLSVTEELRIPLVLPEGRKAHLYRLALEAPVPRIAALVSGEERFAEALRALDEERATDDPLSGLILDASLDWREVEVLRTLRNHLLQIRTHYNVETVNGVLLRNHAVAAALFRSFAARFDPDLAGDRAAAMAEAEKGVRNALESVRSLAEDEVLRGIDNLIRACLRTNFFQRPLRPVFAIKLDSRKVEGMPSPRPMFEIYVHSRLLEGIHLRGGKVARGGIRWSDRHDDFRTEVLGLMKTQMVKNSIIVPVGSKGGFVLKGNVPGRPALDAYLIDRYREFISGLLDVTDNIVDGKVLHPPEVVFHDGDDPYLVVAADKGTAHLSDTANSVSAQYGFWLGDAFASGGSVGYDHKKVGITARGAWECVKHHFRNLGADVQREPFTCVGIGDMSGDVFGNGLLQSRATRLLGAFNHQHIFVDPDPDPEKSFAERERIFRLPRSTWRDYDAALISRGGGIFERSAKSIPLSPELKRLLEIDGEAASGEEVIRLLLCAKVDLLYNGGIGTYLKHSSEDDTDVGDRANDRVRVDGRDVRARVVAEGGNLGLTQRGRLEYWLRGGLLNTDAVDNSGGVDMSDHEVNLKILMNLLLRKGVIRTKEERNRILMEMTEEVADLVLLDNADQALALSLDSHRSAAHYEEFVAQIEDMLGAGVLNRQDDAIPTKDELLASPSRPRGLPRPLLAVLLGHTKMWAFEMLLETSFPDSPSGQPLLEGYFPRRLQQAFREHFRDHTLRREIVATAGVNRVVNCAGITFLERMLASGKAGLGEVVAAWLDVDRESGASELRGRIVAALSARDGQIALLEMEDRLEALALEVLEGKRDGVAGGLKELRERLKL